MSDGHEPWETYTATPEPTLLEKIVVIFMMIVSAIFFKKRK
jgi:hypothetical protein